MDALAPEHTRRDRPRAVSFVGAVVLVEAVLLVVVGILAFEGRWLRFDASAPLTDPFWPLTESETGLGFAVAALATGLAQLIAGAGLLRMHSWAWILALTVQGATLAGALYGYLHGRQPFAALALGSFLVLVLNQREVREAFVLPSERR